MTGQELYSKYCGCTVKLSNGTTGEVIGYSNKYDYHVLIGISISQNGKGWRYDQADHHVLPKGLLGYTLFYYITENELFIIKPKTNDIKIDNLEESAEEWLKSQENFQSMNEEEANIRLNSFIEGAKWYKKQTKQ
jgi:hypothetical protein